MFLGQKKNIKMSLWPKAIYRFQWGTGCRNVFLCTRLMDPRPSTLLPTSSDSVFHHASLGLCFGRLASSPSCKSGQFLRIPGLLLFCLERPAPRSLPTVTVFRSLRKCHPFSECVLTVDKYHPATLAELLPFLARIIVCHTTYLPADRSLPPARNVRAWEQESRSVCGFAHCSSLSI